ncbi:MAG: DUF4065 domain-containing protein [Candidatus Aegiribacteria sp.]|nr:DUF4065 domain-containing protein [Candidatus Aegiribacteria sp.]
MKIGGNIKKLREKLGMRQEDLAKQMGLSRSTITQIEGNGRKVTVEELIEFANVMNISIEILINPDLKPEEVVEYSISEPDMNQSKVRISIPQNNFEKFKEVLLYVLCRIGAKPNIGETVLYKLLYFIDFDYYEKYEDQLIGATYIKNTYGPTPTHFHTLVEEMIEEGSLARVSKKYFNYPQTKYLPRREPNISKLTGTELDTINDVLCRLGEMNATQISEYSHKDIPWITAKEGDHIEYESVFYRTPEYSMRED